MRAWTRARNSWRRIAAMAHKEFRQLVRDRATLAMIVGIPAMQLVLFGYAINLDVRHVPTALLDRASSGLSRRLAGELAATQTFDIRRRADSDVEAFRLLERSEVGAVIVIPSDVDRRLYRGRGMELSIFADATNPSVASAIALAGEGYGRTLAAQLQPFVTNGAPGALRMTRLDRSAFGAAPELVRSAPVQVEVLPFYNPERRTAVFIVPGLIGVILTMTMMLMTALALVRERERGTFEFLIATPIRGGEVMIGKILPYLVVGHVQVALVLFLGWTVFDVPLHGHLFDLGLGAVPFLAAMLMLGLVISSVVRTQFQATQLSFFFFLPSMLLSGFMFPFESMPEPAQWAGQVLPLTHFLHVARGVLLKGAPAEALMLHILAIAAFAVAALGIAVATFRKRLE
jgi:ABC-2 type transport system permease protein